jgi:curved DNA-binding protein CbpA
MKRVENQDYYQILEVPYNASWGEIQKSYELVKATYSKGALATYSLFDFNERGRILDKIEEAYLVLSHPEKRAKYDRAIAVLLAESADAPLRVETPTAVPPTPPSTVGVMVVPTPVVKAEIKEAMPTDGAISVNVPTHAVENDIVSGKILKGLREEQGITLDEIADKTRININYLEFIEASSYGSLPAPVYIMSYLKQYAKIVGIDSAMLEEYMKGYQRWCDSPKPNTRRR